ncbi:putative 4-hydroxy-2-oxoglutarate aldolase [Talaromyces pinophilus]|nr:putative 4-hydroxy-2-oxoglutarate aldolase [Talaromyces pinophilus]
MGETVHLSHAERSQLIKTARNALDEIQLTETPIIAGMGASSTHESIELAEAAAEAGADFGMVILLGYYARAILSSPGALEQFFIDIATASPIPMFEAPNICGVKLTCVSPTVSHQNYILTDIFNVCQCRQTYKNYNCHQHCRISTCLPSQIPRDAVSQLIDSLISSYLLFLSDHPGILVDCQILHRAG